MPSGIKINELPRAAQVSGSNLIAVESPAGTGTEAATVEQLRDYVAHDALEAISEATGDAVEAIEEKGAETLASIPEDYTKVTGDVADLKSAITDITGDTQIPLVANKYIDLSGSSVTMSGGVPAYSGTSATYSVGYMECSPGDEFCVSGTGGSQTRLWGFVDSSGNILEKANASVSANRLLLTAPTNAAYIIVHTNTNKRSYHTNAAYNAIENAKKYAEKSVSVFAMQDKSRLISEYMLGLLNTSGNFAVNTKRVTYADYMKYPEKIFIYLEHGYCATVCLYNNDKNLTQRTNYLTGQTTLIEIPENTFFRVTIWNYIETDITDIDDVASRIYIWNPYSALYDDSECIAIMESFAVIGDSLSAGYAGSSGGNYGSEAAKTAGRNWPTYLGLRIGRPITNLSRGSSSAHDWRYGNVSLGVNINDADIDTYCYMLAIGVNDARQGNTIGTESDIATDPENNADTFYGNYDYVIRKLRSFANERISQAHIFAFTIPPTESNAETYNAAIRAIAHKYRNSKVHLIDINHLFYHQFLEPPFSDTWVSAHSRPIGYMMMANMIRTAINKYMMENIQWFTWTPWEAIT